MKAVVFAAAALCVLAVLAANVAPAAAQTPFCHRSGYSNITDCKAANATKTALYERAAKEIGVAVTPTNSSCTECGPNTYTVVQQVSDEAAWKKYDAWEHEQPEYKKEFTYDGVNKGLNACKANGACTQTAMAPNATALAAGRRRRRHHY